MKKTICFLITILFVCTSAFAAEARTDTMLTVNRENTTHDVSPLLYGAFIEDLSYACDGGLVANLVNNGSFEDGDKPENAWYFDNVDVVLSHGDAMNANNPSYESIRADGRGSIENIGFTELYKYKTYDYNEKKATTADMSFEEGVDYEFSCYVKNVDFDGTIGVYLNSKSNRNSIIQLATNGVGNTQWTRLTATLRSRKTEKGSLVIVLDGKGELKLDFVSLVAQNSYGYGKDEWKNVTLRPDMVEALKNLSPAFIRFPGGCFAEGNSLDNLYTWKHTIGSPEQRKQSNNVWADANNGRYYVNTNAMGYHEYFQLCEDLNAEAVPVVNAGITCQLRNGYGDLLIARQKINMTDGAWTAYLVGERGFDEKDEDGMAEYTKYIDSLGIKSEEDYKKKLSEIALEPGTPAFKNYVQDILDLIEYANADANTSYWGALRAANGHEEPFDVRYLEIGNENFGDVYFRNLSAIYKAVHKKYPKLKIITSAGNAYEGSEFEKSFAEYNQNYKSATLDEHYYVSDNWLLENTHRYDGYDRQSGGVLVGEHGTFSESYGTMITKNNMRTATAVGAYMTGLERNSDVVKMASMAPTFAKVNANCWEQNLIWFNSDSLSVTPDYYTQLMFANNLGTKYADAVWNGSEDVFYSVTVDPGKEIMYIKLVNTGGSERFTIQTGGANAASALTMSHKYKSASNEIKKQRVAPEEKELEVAADGSIDCKLEANSVNVIRVAYGNNKGDNFYHLPDTLDVKTHAYIPATGIVALIVISVCLFGGMAAGYLTSAKILAKRKKD